MPVDNIMDPETGKVRLHAGMCGTCVFGPTHANLRPGRLRELVNANIGDGKMGLQCHETLDHTDTGVSAGLGPGALCRGFYDKFGHLVNGIRVMERLGGFTEIDPPDEEALRRAREI